ncbi:MAG: RNA polymerase sigma factor [Thermoanaerobaculia bacterium]|nr:RNA polymerase sigma factor [Thermoanaerobaculia bacterium]
MSENPIDLDLERARLGDLEAFRVLVERHSRDVFALAFRMTRCADDADDVVQETFMKAWRKLPDFEARAAFGSWLYRIATNCSYDLLRRRSRRLHRETPLEVSAAGEVDQISAPAGLSPEGRLDIRRDFDRELGRALEDLTGAERTAFVLRHIEERSVAEIGELLGMKTNAAKQTVFRAVRKVRNHLSPLMEATR